MARPRRPEATMAKPVIDWLATKGCVNILTEVPVFDRAVDVMGWTPDWTVCAVELKVADWRRALWQARACDLTCDFIWVAMDERHIRPAARNRAMFEEYGIGLLSVGEATVTEVIRPTEQDTEGYYCRQIRDVIARLICGPIDGTERERHVKRPGQPRGSGDPLLYREVLTDMAALLDQAAKREEEAI